MRYRQENINYVHALLRDVSPALWVLTAWESSQDSLGPMERTQESDSVDDALMLYELSKSTLA